MGLESTVVCLDDSEYMRNGDFAPSRLEAQRDAVNLVAGTKLNDHPESTVAVMTMSGRREFLVTLTNDIGRILTAVHSVAPSGELDLLNGIKVARLALKHRQLKNGGQRIIAFVGSPIEADENELTKLGEQLKKNGICVDIISFGEEEANTAKLEAFVTAVNTDENTSHLITVPSGVRVLTDALMSSAMLSTGNSGGGGAGGGGGGGGGGNDFSEYGGINPELDPELALVMRVSMEEARVRQQAEETSGTDGSAPKAPDPSAENDDDAELMKAMQMSQQGVEGEGQNQPEDDDDDMDEEMKLAMLMSMGGNDNAQADDGAAAMDVDAKETTDVEDFSLLSEEEQIARALQMTMDTSEPDQASEDAANDDDKKPVSELLQSETFLTSIFETMPNVDPNDADIREAVQKLASRTKKSEDKKKDDEKK